ncbi:MAG: ribosome maturation factor RimM [Ignavibacteria bacterium]
MLDQKNFISIGKIVKPIGIKGNLKVIYFTDFPERFNKLDKIKLFDETKDEFVINKINNEFDFVISDVRLFDKYVNMRFEGYDNINISKELVPLVLMIHENDRVKLTEGYYVYELTGLDVYDKDKFIGKVGKITNYGSGDLLSITENGKEILIPYKNEFVTNINIKSKRIDVDLIEGFLE